jgi:hypothetical protein
MVVPPQVSVIAGGEWVGVKGVGLRPPFTTIDLETPDLAERLITGVVSACEGGSLLDPPTLSTKVIVRALA